MNYLDLATSVRSLTSSIGREEPEYKTTPKQRAAFDRYYAKHRAKILARQRQRYHNSTP